MNKEKIYANKIVKTIVFCGFVIIAFAFALLKHREFIGILRKLLKIMSPVIIGGIIFFVLNKPLNGVHKFCIKLSQKRYEKRLGMRKAAVKPNEKRLYILALVTVYAAGVGAVTGLLFVIIPQFAESIRVFIENFDVYYENFMAFAGRGLKRLNVKWLNDLNLPESLSKISADEISGHIPGLISTTFGITAGILEFTKKIVAALVNLFLGFVFSVYILAGKERLKAQVKSVLQKILKGKKYGYTAKYIRLTLDTFSNFFTGQLTEAAILGGLCFGGMKLFGFEYALMISAIIGITNIIPIVGPLAGTLPCAFILLLVEPKQALWFIVFIIILQQIESNLIYPRVVGTSVGLPAFWVLLAIVIGGGLGKVLGMVVAVPVMSVLYEVAFNNEQLTMNN